jgi:hypothetical protein
MFLRTGVDGILITEIRHYRDMSSHTSSVQHVDSRYAYFSTEALLTIQKLRGP